MRRDGVGREEKTTLNFVAQPHPGFFLKAFDFTWLGSLKRSCTEKHHSGGALLDFRDLADQLVPLEHCCKIFVPKSSSRLNNTQPRDHLLAPTFVKLSFSLLISLIASQPKQT